MEEGEGDDFGGEGGGWRSGRPDFEGKGGGGGNSGGLSNEGIGR